MELGITAASIGRLVHKNSVESTDVIEFDLHFFVDVSR